MPSQLAGIEYAAAPRAQARASALAWPPRLIVIHDTGNPTSTRRQEASYAANRADGSSAWTSAHFYVDSGGVLGSLRLNFQAWAAFAYANQRGIHIEMCGMNAGDAHAVPPGTIAVTAGLVRQLCALAGIPAVKLSPSQVAAGARGVCGHRDITIGLGVGSHDDPGPRFDWPAFMRQINSGAAAGEDDDMLTPGEAGLLANAERAATALYTGMDPVPMVQPWNEESKTGLPNPIVRIERKVDELAAAVEALTKLVAAGAAGGTLQLDVTGTLNAVRLTGRAPGE